MSSEYKRLRDYEMMVIFHPELSEEDLVAEVSKIEGHITAAQGTVNLVNRETPWGRRRLAYPIRHESRDIRDGVYVLYYFSAESTQLSELEREIKLDDRILRYLLTQQTAPIMEPPVAEDEESEAIAQASPEPGAAASAAVEEQAETTSDAATPQVTEETEPVAEAGDQAASTDTSEQASDAAE